MEPEGDSDKLLRCTGIGLQSMRARTMRGSHTSGRGLSADGNFVRPHTTGMRNSDDVPRRSDRTTIVTVSERVDGTRPTIWPSLSGGFKLPLWAWSSTTATPFR